MADDSLPPFSGAGTRCPKCGTGMDTKWHPEKGNARYPCWRADFDAEHHCRLCPCCGYGWMEATQDSAPASTPTPLHRVLR